MHFHLFGAPDNTFHAVYCNISYKNPAVTFFVKELLRGKRRARDPEESAPLVQIVGKEERKIVI